MAGSEDRRFTEFAQTAAGLLAELAPVVEAPLLLVDHAGVVAACTEGTTIAPGTRLEIDGRPECRRWPLEDRGEVRGWLVAEEASAERHGLLDAVAADLSRRFALEGDIERMTDDLLWSYDQMNLFYEFARILRPDESFAVNATGVLDEAAELLGCRVLVYRLPDGGGTGWRRADGEAPAATVARFLADASRLDALETDVAAAGIADGAGERTVRYRQRIPIGDGAVDCLAIPVRIKDACRGYVGIVIEEGDALIETGEVRLVETLAEELSNAATNAALYRELNDLLYSVVRTLVAAIEAKDRYTCGHSERVVEISQALGRRLGLPQQSLQALNWTAILHDVGKIGIEDGVLNKPGKLTADEYEHIKTHSSAGAKMLEHIAQLQAIVPGIRHHHERYDGGGYPDGLAGEEIPLFSRIIALADTFDAIVSTRSYREAAPAERALAVIGEQAGKQFDPDLANLFLALAAEGEITADASVDGALITTEV